MEKLKIKKTSTEVMTWISGNNTFTLLITDGKFTDLTLAFEKAGIHRIHGHDTIQMVKEFFEEVSANE